MSRPILEVSGLTMRFGGLLAVNGVGLTVHEKQVVSMIGPNGAGKTTVFNCLTGFYQPTDGKILLDGEPIQGLPGHKIARKGVVRTFQNVRLFKDMTAVENLLVPTGDPAHRARHEAGHEHFRPYRRDQPGLSAGGRYAGADPRQSGRDQSLSGRGVTMLYFENVSTFYGKIQALHSVNVEVRKGEIVTLIGANGAGKSTLLMTLCGTPMASEGSIRFEGEELVGRQTCDIMRKDIAVVPEGRRIFARLTVEENLAMGGFFTNKADFQEQLDKVLLLFPRLKERFQQRGGTMSGGEQQMLAIARALMSKPKLLLLDEPSLGLAPIIIQQIFEIIEQLREDGVTIFLVEQNANQALKLADRGYVLENGHIVMQGSGEELLVNPKVRDAYLGG